jgi:hypothetical protein
MGRCSICLLVPSQWFTGKLARRGIQMFGMFPDCTGRLLALYPAMLI